MVVEREKQRIAEQLALVIVKRNWINCGPKGRSLVVGNAAYHFPSLLFGSFHALRARRVCA